MKVTRRQFGTWLAAGLGAASLAGCGPSEEELACREEYKQQQRALGQSVTEKQAERQCDPDHHTAYGAGFYGRRRRASNYRGGGSGSGK